MKNKLFNKLTFFVFAGIGMSGCSTINGHHGIISKEHIHVRGPEVVDAGPQVVSGESCRRSVMIFGWAGHENPVPTIDEAISNALEDAPKANALEDATVTVSSLYTFFYNKGCYRVEGKPIKL
jgi:hypothetical protein